MTHERSSPHFQESHEAFRLDYQAAWARRIDSIFLSATMMLLLWWPTVLMFALMVECGGEANRNVELNAAPEAEQ